MKEEAHIKLSIVIVNFNAATYLERCLSSIYEHSPTFPFEVLIIDNGSQDNSVKMIGDKFSQVKLIKNPVDLHYSKATNQGIKIAKGHYIYCLNPDTVVFNDTLDSIVRFLKSRPDVGAVGSRLLNPDLSDQCTARRFPTPLSAIFGRKSLLAKILPNNRFTRKYILAEKHSYAEPYEVDWLSSAAMLVRRDVVTTVGGLDESFYYWVDADWCHRIKKSGWDIYCVPASKVIHDEGKGSGHKDKSTLNKDIINFHRGAYRYYCRHYSQGPFFLMQWLALVALTLRASVLLIANILGRKKPYI